MAQCALKRVEGGKGRDEHPDNIQGPPTTVSEVLHWHNALPSRMSIVSAHL